MKRLVIIIAWICVVVTAVFLRFDDLGARPFHADEATGASITAQRLESDDWIFDPTHYHGPLLSDLAMPVCLMRGEGTWQEMSKLGLRLMPAIAGSLLVLLPLCWGRRAGDISVLLAGCLLATSPLLVYYSRMFIHEMLLVLFGIAALALVTTYPKRGLPGLLIGLMFATKETFVISVLAWSGAAALLVLEERRAVDWSDPMGLIVKCWKLAWPSLVVALITALAFYTQGFTYWRGAIDAVRTYFVYEVVEGHDKPLPYYFNLLVMPHKAAGVWWYGLPVVVLAVLAYLNSFAVGTSVLLRRTIRFIAYSALGHFLIYSLISYKTPWLACLPWAHVCCLAGFALAGIGKRSRGLQVVAVVVAGLCVASQWRQTKLASGRLDSDARNPFAYVPTRKDAESMSAWLQQLHGIDRSQDWGGVAVVGSGFWPLPWYLRGLEPIKHWPQANEAVKPFPLILAMPEQVEAVAGLTMATHVMVPRGLRDGVPVHLFIRQDLWDHWMQTDD